MPPSPTAPIKLKAVPLVLDTEDVRAVIYGRKSRHSFLLKTPLPRKSKRRAGFGDITPKFQVGQRLRVKEAMFSDGASWMYEADRSPVLVTKDSSEHGAMLVWAHPGALRRHQVPVPSLSRGEQPVLPEPPEGDRRSPGRGEALRPAHHQHPPPKSGMAGAKASSA